MANVLAPFGLTPVRRLDGATWTGSQTHRLIAAANTNAIYQGDVVVSLSTGYIDRASPGTTQIAGVFVGCEYYNTTVNRRVFNNFYPGSGATGDVDCFIIDDPLTVFLAQSWSASTTKVARTNINNNVNFNTHANNGVIPDGNTLSGLSGMVIDADTITTTSTLPFRIVDVPGISNPNPLTQTLGAFVNGYDTTTIYNVVLVAFNNQDFKSLTGI